MADDNKKPAPPPPPPPPAGGKPNGKDGKDGKDDKKGRGGNLLKSLDQSKLKTNAKLIGGLIAVVIAISGVLWFVLLQFTGSSTPPPPPPKKPAEISEQQRRAQELAKQRQAQQRRAQEAEKQRRTQLLQQQQRQQQLQQQQRQSTLSARSGVPAQQTNYYNQQQQQKHLRPEREPSVDEMPFSRPAIKQVRPLTSTWGKVSESLLAVENQREVTITQIDLK